jgi:hypothetical protein
LIGIVVIPILIFLNGLHDGFLILLGITPYLCLGLFGFLFPRKTKIARLSWQVGLMLLMFLDFGLRLKVLFFPEPLMDNVLIFIPIHFIQLILPCVGVIYLFLRFVIKMSK